MNWKQALKSALFIAGFFLILIPLTYIVRTNGDVKDRFVGFYAEKENTLDAVIIGSSPVFPYYAGPKIWGDYGIACYPLSTNLQRPKAGIHLVEEAKKTQSPSLFIFEMRMYTTQDDKLTENMAYTRGVTDNMKYSWNRIRTVNAMVDDVSERYTYYFDIFKYHSNWKTMFLPSQLRTFRYEYPDPYKGHLISDEVHPGKAADYSGVKERTPIPADQEEVLRTLLEYLKKNGDDALFIVSPYKEEEGKQEMYNYMEDLTASYGYRFLNMNNYYEEIGLDFEADFYDGGNHTNAAGAEKCSVFLGAYLNEHYSFQDKRGQAAYMSWDEAYEKWTARTEETKNTIRTRIANQDYKILDGEE